MLNRYKYIAEASTLRHAPDAPVRIIIVDVGLIGLVAKCYNRLTRSAHQPLQAIVRQEYLTVLDDY
jgi:hypothetical protein